jgi:hypothetical protein
VTAPESPTPAALPSGPPSSGPLSSAPPPSGPLSSAPPIAPGPGVVPPFAAPPREGHGRRLGIGITVGVALFVLCCGGGAVGFGALLVTTEHQRVNEARTIVTSYMNDWRKQDYAAAYQLLCIDQKDRMTVAEFTDDLDGETIVEFTVSDPVTQSNYIRVPVHATLDDGSSADPVFDVVVDQDQSTKICGLE